MLPPPAVTAAASFAPPGTPYRVNISQPSIKGYQVFKADPDATLQNIAPCPLTRGDYDRLKMMVDKQVMMQMPVTDARMMAVDLPSHLTSSYLPLPAVVVNSGPRPWMHAAIYKEQAVVQTMPRLRNKMHRTIRVNPVFCGDVLMETVPATLFCGGLWIYLFHLLGVKSPELMTMYKLMHLAV